jgi:hypothetical protein
LDESTADDSFRFGAAVAWRLWRPDTLNLIQSGVTGGSSTSESSCAATLQACKLLISRLNPIMNKLRLQSATVSWDNLISQVILFIWCFWLGWIIECLFGLWKSLCF